MARTVDKKAQEEKIREMVQYVHDKAYTLNVYAPISLHAVNKEVNFIPQKLEMMRFKKTSVTDSHWSVRGESSRSESRMNLAWEEIWPLPAGVE